MQVNTMETLFIVNFNKAISWWIEDEDLELKSSIFPHSKHL